MHLTIYQAVRSNQAQKPEKTVVYRQTELPPTVGEILSMGGDSRWIVVAIESFRSQADDPAFPPTTYLAHVAKQSLPLPEKESWLWALMTRQDPQTSLYLLFDETGQTLLQQGWKMDGSAPPVGHRLLDYDTDKTTPRPFVVDAIMEYQPNQVAGFCQHVYLGRCKHLAEPIAEAQPVN